MTICYIMCMRKLEIRPRNTKPRRDVTGQQFGYLTPEYWEKGVGWHCKCKCGNHTVVDSRNLYSGHTTSCGCKRYETKNLNDLSGFENEHLIVLDRVPNNGQTKWRCICKHCGKEFVAQANHLLGYQSCGCVHSQNEINIMKLLDAANVDYAKQYTFKDLFYKSETHPLRFDFAIFKDGKLSHLIEFNGSQHYDRPLGSWSDSYDELIIRDKLKAKYCKEHNIELRIIKYDQDYTLDDLI